MISKRKINNRMNHKFYSFFVFLFISISTWIASPVLAGNYSDSSISNRYNSKNNNVAPVITLVGLNPLVINIGGVFTDPGATALDAEDGDITSSIVASSTVNTTVVGTYNVFYSVTDSGRLMASSTRVVNVVAAPSFGGGGGSNSGSSGGGVMGNASPSTDSRSSSGSGGNGPIVGTFGVVNSQPKLQSGVGVPPRPTVLGALVDNSCYYLHDYLRADFKNNPAEVIKLQIFLRSFEGATNVQINGLYDDVTIQAVKTFQIKYKNDVLIPWGYDGAKGTGYTYLLTKKKVNEIICNKPFPLTLSQKAEINKHKNSSLGSNITIVEPIKTKPVKSEQEPIILKDNTKTSNNNLSTLAGVSTTTRKITGSFLANVTSVAKNGANLLLSMILWPFTKNSSVLSMHSLSLSNFIIFILLLVIIVISYMWYKERQHNKAIEEINKEIDLK